MCLNFAHKVLKLDKTQNGELERGKSGWSSSRWGCFAYHRGYVALISHHTYGELNLFQESRQTNWVERMTKKFKHKIEASGSFLSGVDFVLSPLDSPTMTLRTHTQLLTVPSCNLNLESPHAWRHTLLLFEFDTHLRTKSVWLETVEWCIKTLPATWLYYQTR